MEQVFLSLKLIAFTLKLLLLIVLLILYYYYVGIAGITTGIMTSPKEIILSDLDSILPLLKRNVMRNKLLCKNDNIIVKEYKW